MGWPAPVKPGDLWALTAPASPAESALVYQAKREIESWGFPVVLGKTCFEREDYLAGFDDLRAQELNAFFENPHIKVILCLRGGYGSLRILQRLDYTMIRENPKVMIGFSDITALHIALIQRTGLATFHGPMGVQIAKGLDPISRRSLLEALMRPWPLRPDSLLGSLTLLNEPGGEIEAAVIGGNLTMVAATLGTPFEIEVHQKYLFLEEVHEEVYRIDRLMTQLELANKLQEAEGFLIGDFGLKEDENLRLKSLLMTKLLPLGKPILYGVQAGHCQPNRTIPLGATLKLFPLKNNR